MARFSGYVCAMNASHILRQLGGATAVAKALGVGRSAVSNWPRDGIPPKYWLRLSRITDDAGRPVIGLDDLEAHTRAPAADAAPAQASA
jgi:hypothetical protein